MFIKTSPIPVLTAKEPKDRLAEFYQKLGWDDTSYLEPNLVKITEEDWLYLLDAELTHAKSIITDMHEVNVRIGVGMMWANTGPSGDGQTPGMVELHPEWMRT
jgi:hypothetical protein